MVWNCITVWECQLKSSSPTDEYKLCCIFLEDRIVKSCEIAEEEYGMVAEPVESYGKSK